MTQHTQCPYCGHQFIAGAPAQRGNWHVDPYAGRVTWRSITVCDHVTWVRLLHVLAAAAPAIVPVAALLDQVARSDRPNTIRSMVSRMRRHWPAGVPWPVENVHGHGYRWVGA